MKTLKLLLLFTCFITAAKANRINLNTYKGGNPGYYISSNFTYSPGDTFELSGSWTYCSMDHINGTAAKPVVFINNGNVDMSAGFSFTACKFIYVAKSSSGYFKIHDDINKSNVGITITGLSHVIKVDNIEIYNKLYGMWIKWESNQTGCDSTQWYPHYIDSITVTNCIIHDVNQEGIYGGSTDPSGSAVERAVNCYGKTFTPRSAPLKDIFVEYNTIYNTGRTGIQLSALTFGKYRVNHNTLRNNGFEVSLTQWPCIWIGGEGEGDGEIGWNSCDSASRNIITFYGNKAYIHDNTAKNAGIARDKNTGTIYRFSYYSPLSIEIKPTNPYTKTTFKVKNNTFLPNYTNVAVNVTYTSKQNGSASDFTDTGNYICNSGTIKADNGIQFYNGCAGGDTSTTSVKVPCDTPRRGTFHKLILYDSIVPLKDTMILKTYENGKRFYYVHTKQDKIFHNSKDSTYDSTFICPKCGNCDSLIYNINVNKLYGLMPFKTANDYGIENTRDQLNVRFFKTQKQNKIRIRNYDGGHVTLNLSTKNLDTSKASYLTDTVAYKTMVKDAVDSFNNIKKYVIENEEGNQNYFAPGQDISLYCNMFAAALHQLNSQGITDVTNGGLIWIRFWYYSKTHDADFFNTCFNSIQRSAWNNGNLSYKTQQVTYEIDFLKNLATLKKINIHQLYVSDTSEFAGLVRMVDYLKSYTGKQVTSNEVGYYVDDENILSGLFVLALLENFDDLIYYSGDGSDDALPIPQDEISLIL